MAQCVYKYDTISITDDWCQLYFVGGGRSRACCWSWKPAALCDPSQKGLFAECPQRHRANAVRPARPYARPSISTSSHSPSMRNGPSFRTMIFVEAILPPQAIGSVLGHRQYL